MSIRVSCMGCIFVALASCKGGNAPEVIVPTDSSPGVYVMATSSADTAPAPLVLTEGSSEATTPTGVEAEQAVFAVQAMGQRFDARADELERKLDALAQRVEETATASAREE